MAGTRAHLVWVVAHRELLERRLDLNDGRVALDAEDLVVVLRDANASVSCAKWAYTARAARRVLGGGVLYDAEQPTHLALGLPLRPLPVLLRLPLLRVLLELPRPDLVALPFERAALLAPLGRDRRSDDEVLVRVREVVELEVRLRAVVQRLDVARVERDGGREVCDGGEGAAVLRRRTHTKFSALALLARQVRRDPVERTLSLARPRLPSSTARTARHSLSTSIA